MFSDILGVKIVAKKGDTLGNLEVFVLRVGCWGWVVWEGKMHMKRIDFVTDFLWVKFDAKKWQSWGKFKVFVLGVGCWGVLVEGGEIQKMRISFITDFYG